MTSDTKKEFLQKYMLNSYSCAIPTNILPGKPASLGEYCDPVDSYKGKPKRPTEDSEDSDPGYALPQDALDGHMNNTGHLRIKTGSSVEKDENSDLYELAQNPVEGYDVPPPKKTSPKPSPKPRSSTYRHSQASEASANKDARLSKTSSKDDPEVEPRMDTSPQDARRRPGKKVVEIEYEVASDLRFPMPNPPLNTANTVSSVSASLSSAPFSHKDHDKHTTANTASPKHRKSSATQCSPGMQMNPPSIPPPIVPPPKVPSASKEDFVYSMSQPSVGAPTESMYEEPWDLKARRLKEKEEKRASKSALGRTDNPGLHAGLQGNMEKTPGIEIPSNIGKPVGLGVPGSKGNPPGMEIPANRGKPPGMEIPRNIGKPSSIKVPGHMRAPGDQLNNKAESIYEDAWDCVAEKRKLEARLSYARSLSTTSETEIFHDALENLPNPKTNTQPEKLAEPKLKPLPADTYEDAWDLKNSSLEQKIREMQVQASATYEEPWDLKRQHQQLQARLSTNAGNRNIPITSNSGGREASVSAAGAGSRSSKLMRQYSTSDSYEQSWSGGPPAESQQTSSSRGKHHGLDESSRTKAKLVGCNVGQRINPMIPLANQNWYHGNISRDDAEKMLRVCKEGSYIVRISSDRKSYSLSIKSAKQNVHVQIEQVALPDGSIRYILGKNSKEFSSIPEMIDYYTHHRVPLKGAEHITLLHPVECKWSSSNHV